MTGIEAGLIAGTRAGSALPGLPEPHSYTWRDPRRVPPARLAALEARDRAISLLDTVSDSARLRGSLSAEASKAEAAQRRAEFAELREQGWSVPEAALAVGVSESTGCKYEHDRRKALTATPDRST